MKQSRFYIFYTPLEMLSLVCIYRCILHACAQQIKGDVVDEKGNYDEQLMFKLKLLLTAQ